MGLDNTPSMNDVLESAVRCLRPGGDAPPHPSLAVPRPRHPRRPFLHSRRGDPRSFPTGLRGLLSGAWTAALPDLPCAEEVAAE